MIRSTIRAIANTCNILYQNMEGNSQIRKNTLDCSFDSVVSLYLFLVKDWQIFLVEQEKNFKMCLSLLN